MQQTSLLLEILKALSNFWVVAACVLVVIGIRILWVRHQRGAHAAAAREFTGKVEKRGRGKSDAVPPAPEPPKKKKDYVLEAIDTVLIALILVFGLVRPLLLETFFIPSASMEPTLLGPYDPNHTELYQGSQVRGSKRAGDKLIANKLIYRVRHPERGDVVVFQPPVEAIVGNGHPELVLRKWLEENPGTLTKAELEALRVYLIEGFQSIGIDSGELPFGGAVTSDADLLARLPAFPVRPDDYIKRVIGLPGDHIRIVAGTGVYINGRLLDEPYLPGGKTASARTFPAPPPPQEGMPFPSKMPRLAMGLATLGGTPETAVRLYAAQMMAWLNAWKDNVYLYDRRVKEHVVDGDYIVPPDMVFVMGDNRSENGSFDSRYWGAVPLSNVKARAVSTFWPLTRLKLL